MAQKYTELSPAQTKSVFKLIDKIDGDHSFHENHVKILKQELSFAPSWEKIICEDYSTVPFKSKTYLKQNKNMIPVTYSANPWDDNNIEKMDLDLNNQNISAYIKFYFECFVKGSDILKPVSFSDEIEWQGDLSPSMKQSLDKDFVLYPQIIQQKNDFMVKMPCVFRQSIMIVDFKIDESGKIEIQSKQSLVDDLPIRYFA